MGRRVLATIASAVAVAATLMVSTVSAATAADTHRPMGAGEHGKGITPNAQLPEAIRVDESAFRITETLRGVGKQVYDCDRASGTYKFREPIAGLVTLRNAPAGIHGVGPFWASLDGSRVNGTSPVSAPSPAGPANIAWLKLTAASTAGQGGVFSNVAFIQRTDTRGGVAPASCDASSASTVSIDYSTIYVFWAPR